MMFAATICIINEEAVCRAKGSICFALIQITTHSNILMSKLMKTWIDLFSQLFKFEVDTSDVNVLVCWYHSCIRVVNRMKYPILLLRKHLLCVCLLLLLLLLLLASSLSIKRNPFSKSTTLDPPSSWRMIPLSFTQTVTCSSHPPQISGTMSSFCILIPSKIQA